MKSPNWTGVTDGIVPPQASVVEATYQTSRGLASRRHPVACRSLLVCPTHHSTCHAASVSPLPTRAVARRTCLVLKPPVETIERRGMNVHGLAIIGHRGESTQVRDIPTSRHSCREAESTSHSALCDVNPPRICLPHRSWAPGTLLRRHRLVWRYERLLEAG